MTATDRHALLLPAQRLSRRQLITALAAGGLAPWLGSAQAAAYPEHPIKVVLMFPPGGGSNDQTRLIAEKLKTLLGQTVLIENRPGGGGIIAANAVKGRARRWLHAAARERCADDADADVQRGGNQPTPTRISCPWPRSRPRRRC